MKVADVIRLIEEAGWVLARTRGSHRQHKHPVKAGLGNDCRQAKQRHAERYSDSVLKQAGLKEQGT